MGSLAACGAGGHYLSGVPNILSWHDAAQVVGKNNNDPGSQWDDLSGRAKHATNATSGQQPLFKTNLQGGLPGWYFDGSNDYLACLLNNNDPSITWFLVGRFTGSNSVSDRIACIGQELAGVFYWSDKYGYYQVGGGNGNFGTGVAPTSCAVLEMVYSSASSMAGIINGSQQFTGDPHDDYQSGSKSLFFGCQDSGAFFGECYIHESIVIGDPLTSDLRQRIRWGLGSKWQVGVS